LVVDSCKGGRHTTIAKRENIIKAINKLVRTSRQMLLEIGREPTGEELAQRLRDAIGNESASS
jgi:DNA-directed RNA polymerase sigma subunit (sigma70/sigma32)